ncbi:hypothetical protein HDE_13644 [Halotydeus destructor]|nr:hypothetical protein HDE_13644 [Halotydeus destructor]
MARGSQTSRRSLGQAIEHVTDLIGDWGRWQSSLFYFYLTISVFQAFNNLGMPLMSAKTDFRCKLANYSFADTQFDRCFVDTNKTVPCTDWEFDTSQYAKTMQSEVDKLSR